MIRSARVLIGGEAMRAPPDMALGWAAFDCVALVCAALAVTGCSGAAIGPPGTGGAAVRGPWESRAGLMLKKLAPKSEHNKNIANSAIDWRIASFNLEYCTPEGSCQTFPSPVKASEDA
ncbi:hypothetical protein [Xanthobacter flavus]|uniref:hypothetical protein n=1 Tax=Xanthobacter flavus TaxID=281 RepID=UPI001AE7906B|nr:hypothetical protein [Xanthobacter flavus]MBP2148362.1 hypothetical protein [Xanthobacter flavus]